METRNSRTAIVSTAKLVPAVCAAILMTGCLEDDGTVTNPMAVTPTAPVSPVVTPAVTPETPITPVTPVAPVTPIQQPVTPVVDVTPPDAMPSGPDPIPTAPVVPGGQSADAQALARLTPATAFTFNFPTGDVVSVTVPFPASGIETDPSSGVSTLLTEEIQGEATLCVNVEGLYLCLTAVEAGGGVVTTFELASDNRGSGVFEVCAVGTSLDSCLDDMSISPDGTLSVIAGVQAVALLADGNDRYLEQDRAYLEYYKQGVSQEPNELAAQFSVNSAEINFPLHLLDR